MSWLRIEGKMPQHAKVAPLSDSAFRLHVTAMAWSAEFHTDGLIGPNLVGGLTRAPSGQHLRRAVAELIEAKLWHMLDGRYQIHDFLDWNMSKLDYEKRSHSGAAGGKAKAENASKRLAGAKQVLKRKASESLAVSVSVSESEEKRSTRAPRKPKNGARFHEEQPTLGLDMGTGGDLPIEGLHPTKQVQAHYEAEFLRTRGERAEFGKKWSRATGAFKELQETHGVNKAKIIVENALSAQYCMRFMPWELVDDAMKWVVENGKHPLAIGQPQSLSVAKLPLNTQSPEGVECPSDKMLLDEGIAKWCETIKADPVKLLAKFRARFGGTKRPAEDWPGLLEEWMRPALDKHFSKNPPSIKPASVETKNPTTLAELVAAIGGDA